MILCQPHQRHTHTHIEKAYPCIQISNNENKNRASATVLVETPGTDSVRRTGRQSTTLSTPLNNTSRLIIFIIYIYMYFTLSLFLCDARTYTHLCPASDGVPLTPLIAPATCPAGATPASANRNSRDDRKDAPNPLSAAGALPPWKAGVAPCVNTGPDGRGGSGPWCPAVGSTGWLPCPGNGGVGSKACGGCPPPPTPASTLGNLGGAPAIAHPCPPHP